MPISIILALLIIKVPFEHIGLDLVEDKMMIGEIIMVCGSTSKKLAWEVFQLFSRIGIPQRIVRAGHLSQKW